MSPPVLFNDFTLMLKVTAWNIVNVNVTMWHTRCEIPQISGEISFLNSTHISLGLHIRSITLLSANMQPMPRIEYACIYCVSNVQCRLI